MCILFVLQPLRRISVSQSSVRKKRDSILLDSNYSRSNLKAMLFSIKERESGGITTIAPDAPEDKVANYLTNLSEPGGLYVRDFI